MEKGPKHFYEPGISAFALDTLKGCRFGGLEMLTPAG
jgi:hypothetical protein